VDRISKNTQILHFIKIRLVGAELFHADGRTGRQTDRQTDRHVEANSHFLQFADATKMQTMDCKIPVVTVD
jgi:Holliday junction resolvase-like predicted endonuclease